MAVHSGARCISTPMVNWMLHIMMPLDACCMNLDGAVRHNFLWPIIYLRLLPIFVNWCILCGDPWILQTMFLLMLHYVLIYLIDDLFLEGGATFSFNFYVLLLMCFYIVFYCMGFEPAIECEWMNEWINEWIIDTDVQLIDNLRIDKGRIEWVLARHYWLIIERWKQIKQ